MQGRNPQRIFTAARDGSVHEVTNALREDVPADFADEDEGFTALHLAVEQQHYLVVATLLDGVSREIMPEEVVVNKADVNRVRTDNGKTSLQIAVEKNDIHIARLLLIKGKANPDKAKDPKSNTISACHKKPLLLALEHEANNLEMVSLLIECGAQIDPSLFPALARVCKHNSDQKLFIRGLKQTIFARINAWDMTNEQLLDQKISILEDAFNPVKPLGKMMYTQCGLMPCRKKRGTLLAIHTALVHAREYKEAKNRHLQANQPLTNEDLITAINEKKTGAMEYIINTMEGSISHEAFFAGSSSSDANIAKQLMNYFLDQNRIEQLHPYLVNAKQSRCNCVLKSRIYQFIKMVKDKIIEAIKTAPENEKLSAAEDATKIATDTGRIIYMQRKTTTCKPNHGSLKQIQKIINELLKPKSGLAALSAIGGRHQWPSQQPPANQERIEQHGSNYISAPFPYPKYLK